MEADRRHPADRRAALELAQHYYDVKDYENSYKWLARLGPAEASQVEARFIRGVDEFFLGKNAASEKTFAELSRDTPLAEVWNNLGFLQSHRSRWMEAMASFDRAYQADSSDPDYSFNLGVCLWNQKRYPVAVRYLREALQSAPEDLEIHRLLRESLAAAGDVEGRKKEDQWLEVREESAGNGNGAILPQPRLKKQFNRRAYRAWLRMGQSGKVAQSRGADAAGPKP
jgi:tetratricopeptide (TPR) repeat protein